MLLESQQRSAITKPVWKPVGPFDRRHAVAEQVLLQALV